MANPAECSALRLTAEARSDDPFSQTNARMINDSSPQQQASLRSSMSLPNRQQFDVWLRYVGKLGDRNSAFAVPAYTTLDLRYA